MRPLLGRSRQRAAGEDCLHAVEQVFGDQWLEVAALAAHAVLGHVHDAGVYLVALQDADRLQRERLPAAIREPPAPDQLE